MLRASFRTLRGLPARLRTIRASASSLAPLRQRIAERKPTTTAVLGLLLASLCAFALLYRLGSAALFDPDEGRNAEIAREILVLQDWATPHYNFVPRLDKPIFFYWLVALSYTAFGVSEWSARLPSVMAALGCIAVAALWAKAVLGTWQALWAGLILVASVEFIILARTVIVDMALNFFVTVALAAFYGGTRVQGPGPRRLLSLVAFAAMGFATLLKGPVGFVLPALVAALYLACSRQWSVWRELKPLCGCCVFILIVVTGYAWAELHNRGFLQYFLLEENLGRFFTTRFNRVQPLYYYVLVLAVGFFPWSLFLLAGAKFWRQKITDERILFLALWTLVPVALYTISRSKLPAYILPAFPPLAILSAEWLVYRFENSLDRRNWTFSSPWLLMAAIVLVFIVAGAQWGSPLTSAANAQLARIFSSISPVHRIALWAGFALLAWASWKATWPKLEPLYFCYLAGIFLFIVLSHEVVSAVSITRSSKDAVEEAATIMDAYHPVVMYEANLSSLPFYLRARAPLWIVTSRKRTIMGSTYVAEYLAKKGDHLRGIVFTPEEFSRLPPAVKRQLWIFTPAHNLPRLRALGVIDTIGNGQTVRLVRFR